MHEWTPGRIRIYILFALSGAAALTFEVVFLRQLAWIFGNSAAATALVLAAFMAGLALGAAFFGRLADRTTRPLRLFGLLELGTAASAAGLAWLLGTGRALFLAPLRWLEPGRAQHTLELALAFALVLVPTVLMGGTLPALGRHLIREMGRFVGSLGLLYGVNTLGAAAGVFLAGFYLVELLGVSGSAWLAAGVQAAVGLTALWLDRADRARDAAPPAETAARVERPGAAPDAAPAGRTACLLAAGVGGLAVLGYEVVWTRLLALPMRSFSYSFSLMLAVFLLGLCLGAALLSVAGRRIQRPAAWVGAAQVLMGLYVALSLYWLPESLAPVGASSFEGFLLASTLRAAAIVLPPTVLSGMVLPLAARGFASSVHRVGREVGLVYGVNTAGAIAGSLLAGLLLLPTLGAPTALAALALLQATAGLAVVAAVEGRSLRTWLAAALAAVCAAPLVGAVEGRFLDAFLRAGRDADRVGEVLFFHEGATDTVAIVRKDYGFHDPRAKSLITNGVAMSATVKPVWRYMALEGHLPVLLAERPRRAIAVGVGTGITLAAVVSHPELESIVAVELSEGVIRGLEVFEEENARAFEDPRVRLVAEDGRHWLELNGATFDVITLEPPPPIVAGSVHLYSLDFYRLCLERLAPGGVVAQWLPLHAQSLASARMTARTFLDAFPHATLWLPSARDAVLLGAASPPRLDLDRLRRAYETPSTRRNLEQAYLETPEALLGTYLLDRAGIEAWAAGAPTITDDRPWMEFFRHQGGNMTDRDILTLLAQPQAGREWVPDLAALPELARRVSEENAALRLHARATAEGSGPLRAEAARGSRGTQYHRYGFGCADDQIEALARAAATTPETLSAHRARCAELTPPGASAGQSR